MPTAMIYLNSSKMWLSFVGAIFFVMLFGYTTHLGFFKIKMAEESFMQIGFLASAFMFLLSSFAIAAYIHIVSRSCLYMIFTGEGFYGPNSFRKFTSWSEIREVHFGFIEFHQDAFFQYPKFLNLEKRKKRLYFHSQVIDFNLYDLYILLTLYHDNYQEREMQQD